MATRTAQRVVRVVRATTSASATYDRNAANRRKSYDRNSVAAYDVNSARNNDVNPEVYLADVLIRLQDHPKDLVAELLPHRWKERFGSGFTVERTVAPPDAT
jgi:hypothetical protein